MASIGSRVFVLGGLGGGSSEPGKPEDHSRIHVLETSKSHMVSMYHLSNLCALEYIKYPTTATPTPQDYSA